MNGMDDKWIDNIIDKMRDYEAAPPDGLLESVQSEIRSRMIRKRRIWWGVAASIALLIGLFSPMIVKKVDNSIPLMVNVAEVYEHREMDSSKTPTYKTMAHAAVHTVKMPTGGHESLDTMVDDPGAFNAVGIEDTEGETKITQESDNGIDKGWEYPGDIPYSSDDNDIRSDSKVKVKNKGLLTVGIAGSANGAGGLLNSGNIAGNSTQASTFMPSTRMGGGSLTNSPIDADPTPTFVEVFDHKLPARFSIDFSWSVGHKLNIGTGISYSYLRSDIKYGYSDSPLLKATQNLHFVGIPVNLRYTPWRYRKLELYTSVGFMAEKCIFGDIKEDSPSNPGYSYVGCDERPFQFSFNAAAGVQYTLASKCAVFVEPGLGMYIKNGSRLRTIYSERPFTFNVNVGFRFGH